MKTTLSFLKRSGMGTVCAWLLAGCTQKLPYPTPPFTQVLDLSKPGVIYEQTFSVPGNREWAPQKFEFGQAHTNYNVWLRFSDTVPGRRERELEEVKEKIGKTRVADASLISLLRVIGHEKQPSPTMSEEEWKNYLPVMEKPGAPIVLKVTFTPLQGVTQAMDYLEGLHHWSHKRTHLAPGQAIDATFDLSRYGPYGTPSDSYADKLLLYFGKLQLHGSYRLRIENMNPLQLPSGIQTELVMELGRVKF